MKLKVYENIYKETINKNYFMANYLEFYNLIFIILIKEKSLIK